MNGIMFAILSCLILLCEVNSYLSLQIDFVEINNSENTTTLPIDTPLRLVRFLTESQLLIQDHDCAQHFIESNQVSRFYSIYGNSTTKLKCKLERSDVIDIMKAKKERFGLLRPLFARLSQPLFDFQGDLVLQSDIDYQIVMTDLNKSLDVVFDNNCKLLSLREDMISTTISKIVTTSEILHCGQLFNRTAIIVNQTKTINLAEISPYEIHPSESNINITAIPIAFTIKDLLLNNVAKSNLIIPNLEASVEVNSYCGNQTTNTSLIVPNITEIITTTLLSTISLTKVIPTTVTSTTTLNRTIVRSSEIIRVSPTTITERFTKTNTKTSTTTKSFSIISTKTLKPITSTLKVTEWSTLEPETSFINITQTVESTIELNITLTMTSNVTLPAITKTIEQVSLTTVISTSKVPVTAKVTKTRLLDILITKTRKVCPTRSYPPARVQPSSIRRLSRSIDENDQIFQDPVSLNESVIHQYLPTFEDHQKSLNMTSDLAYEWLKVGYGYKTQKAIEYLEDNNLPINQTVENVESFKSRYDQLLSIYRSKSDEDLSNNTEKTIHSFPISRQRRQNLSDERTFWYNLTLPYFNKILDEKTPFAYPQWLINMYEVPQEYRNYLHDNWGELLHFDDDVIDQIPQELAWKFVIQRIGWRANLGWKVLNIKNNTGAFQFFETEGPFELQNNHWRVKHWVENGLFTFKEDKTIQFPPGTALPHISTDEAVLQKNNKTIDDRKRSITQQFEKETEELRNKTLETIEDLLSINNRFDNKSYLAGIGAYGIQFTRIGDLYSYYDHYLFVFRVKLPVENLKIPEDYNRGSCNEFLTFLPKLNQTNRLSGEKLYNSLNETCRKFEEAMDSMTMQINATAIKAVKEFQIRTFSRAKRFDPITLAVVGVAAVASLAVYSVTNIENGRSERKELFKRTLELEKKMEKISEGVAILGEAFLGFQKKTLESFIEFDTKVEILRNYTIDQGEFLKQAIANATHFLDDKTMFSTIMSNVNAYRLAHTNVMQNKLILILDQIRQLESIFIVLNEGVMSHELVPWAKLEQLLIKIENQFSKDFILGILPSERHLYYQLPLTSYSIDTITNDLYVSLKIPLIRRNRVRTYEIIKIQANPFVCQNDSCFNFGGYEKALSFDLNGRLLLVNPTTGLLLNEVDYESLICRFQGHRQLCHSFNPNQFYEISPCSKAIFDFNAFDIAKHCPLKQREVSEYTPTAVTNNAFIIHSKLVPSYDILCKGDNPIRVRTDAWVEALELKRGCDYYLSALGKILYGPLGEVLKSKENITLYQSELITLIEEASNQTKYDFSQFGLDNSSIGHFMDFDASKHKVTLSWDKSTVNRYADYINQVSRNITTVIQDMRSITGKTFSSYAFKGFIGSLTGIIQVMSTLILVFGVLTYSKLLGFTSSLTVIAPRRVDAISLDLGFDILPNDYTTLMDMLTALTLIIMIGLIVKITFFRKHFISSHFIRGEGLLSADTKFKISINITHTTNSLCSINTENIYISIPLNRFNRLKFIRDIRLKNILYTWLLKKDNDRHYFKLAEDLQLIAIDENDSTHSCYHRIFIPIDKMGFVYSGRPMAFLKANNYGKAYVTITKRIDSQYGESSRVNETQI